MKKATLLASAVTWLVLSITTTRATLYWDSNGTNEGAGATPNGVWGSDPFWNPNADGTNTSPAAWITGEDAAFSAGTDATGPFTVTINGAQTAGNVTVEEGTLSISGGAALSVGAGQAGKGIIDVAGGSTAGIDTLLTGGDDAGQITKSGGGTLVLNASCTPTASMTIAGGLLRLGAPNVLKDTSDLSISNVCLFDMNHFDQTIDGLYGSGQIVNGGTLTLGQNNEAAANFWGAIGDYYDYSPITVVKVGTGKQTLSGTSYYSGLTLIAGGILAIADADALGTYADPTIVSNGAALWLARSANYYESLILNGEGFNGTNGALRNLASFSWSAGATLGSNARINNDVDGQWSWTTGRIIGTDGTSNYNLTIGGNGATTRLNISHPAVNVGTGTITKDGTSKLILDSPSICSAFYFNGGTIYPRNEAQYSGFGSGKIYVGGDPCTLTADFMNVVLPYAIELLPGSRLGFNCNLYINLMVSYDFICNGVISGAGGLFKTNWGTLFLNKANTYTGNTSIRFKTLALGPSGSISNSPVIELLNDATFDVSAVAAGFVLGPNQTLSGSGFIDGNFTTEGALAPGFPTNFGTLTFNTNLTLRPGARLLVKATREGASTNDTISVLGAVCTNAGTGTVVVTNVGPALQVGDRFKLLDQPLLNGQALSIIGGGTVWTNQLAVDGTIAVVGILPPPVTQVPRITSLTVGGPLSIKVAWTNATPGSNYWLQYRTDLSASGWTDLSPVTALSTTAYQTDALPPNATQRYYRVRCLGPANTPASATPRITSVSTVAATTVTVNYTNTVPGDSYVVQYLSNLNTTNWTSLSPIKATATTGSATDTVPADTQRRFYRVYSNF